MAELRDRVLREHGADARIVSAEKVTVGGIRGFFARQHYEVTVAPGVRRPRGAHARLDVPSRAGIAALLDDADEAESRLHLAAPPPGVSTRSKDFAALMDDLTFNTAGGGTELETSRMPRSAHGGAVPAAPQLGSATPSAPQLLSGAGDLIVVAGLREDPLGVAHSLAAVHGGDVRAIGALITRDGDAAWNRRFALETRARGVQLGNPQFIAFGIGIGIGIGARGVQGSSSAPEQCLAALGADQLWLAVDVGRKPSDTALWVRPIVESSRVHALAVVGQSATATPDTALDLGVPIGWTDASAVEVPLLRRGAAPSPVRSNPSR
ncbi:MAG: hypothetical protein JWQ68_2532 [Cryobacterium sp.]|nr:hypothetical protein [Cryobacterium sp.]